MLVLVLLLLRRRVVEADIGCIIITITIIDMEVILSSRGLAARPTALIERGGTTP